MPGTNIFGPHGPGINETTTRIPKSDSGASTDSWFGPCIGNDPNTGTKIGHDILNFILANLRRAIRGMGVAEVETDDDMLLKAIQAAQSNLSLAGFLNLPIFPEIQNTNGLFTFSTSTGQVVINTGLTFLHRGHRLYSTTSDFDAAARTFTTAQSKTYHLRWYPPGHANANPGTYPKGRFMLRDLADGAYNAGAGAESLEAFDTGYDDMLVARVVTNAGNVPTVTPLINRHTLLARTQQTGTGHTSTNNNALGRSFSGDLNWARTPKTHTYDGFFYTSQAGSSKVQGGANIISTIVGSPLLQPLPPTRYGYSNIFVWTDWDVTPANSFSVFNFTAAA